VRWIVNIAACLSQLLNAAVFFGDPNETLSGRCYRERRKIPEAMINTLFFFQPDHCLQSHLADHMFAHKILERRT
jgi:hypothetical protein